MARLTSRPRPFATAEPLGSRPWGERPVLKLSYAALLRASDGWQGVRINDVERGQLQRLAEEIKQQRQQENQPVVETKKRSTSRASYSKART